MSELGEIWRTRKPLVWRGCGALKIRLPHSPDNYDILRGNRRRRPTWNREDAYWEVPAAWFTVLCRELLRRFGELYVVQPHNAAEVCAPACWGAEGLVCECSCMGEHHGAGQPGGRWYVIDETCAVRWRGREWYWARLALAEPVAVQR